MGRIVVGDDKEGASVSVIVNRRAILVAVKSEQERKKKKYIKPGIYPSAQRAGVFKC